MGRAPGFRSWELAPQVELSSTLPVNSQVAAMAAGHPKLVLIALVLIADCVDDVVCQEGRTLDALRAPANAS